MKTMAIAATQLHITWDRSARGIRSVCGRSKDRSSGGNWR
jgi:hypothetical protein